ncbi:MAG: hypothetical protein RL386_1804 [Bacteroidota bacterium]
MRIALSVEHPAWAHQFRGIVRLLEAQGHEVTVFAIQKDLSLYLLDTFGIPYLRVADSTGVGVLQKAWLLISITWKIFVKCIKIRPDLFIGRGSPMMALNAFLFRKPHILFEDTDHSYISLLFCKLFSTRILTNNAFRSELGEKQLRVNTLKELFYLHPDIFRPDLSILGVYGLSKDEPFVVIRFVHWTADHDLGQKGFDKGMKIHAITELAKKGRVLVTSETPLPEVLRPYEIRIAPEKIHDLMAFATLVFGESATMATEAAVLGVHAIFCDFAGRGYTDELEARYGLVYNFRLDPQSQLDALQKAMELLSNPETRASGQRKGAQLLEEKINGTAFFMEQLSAYLHH